MPLGAPRARPPGPSGRAETPPYLSGSSAAGVASSAGGRGPGPEGGGRGCRAGGAAAGCGPGRLARRPGGGEGTVGGAGASGPARARGRARCGGPPRGAGARDGARGAPSSSRRGAPASRAGPEPSEAPAGRPRSRAAEHRARGSRGAVLSPRLTHQSGPGDWHRRRGARGRPAGPALRADGRPESARAGLRAPGCGRLRPGAGAAQCPEEAAARPGTPRPPPPAAVPRPLRALPRPPPLCRCHCSGLSSVRLRLPPSATRHGPVSVAFLGRVSARGVCLCPPSLLTAPLFSSLWIRGADSLTPVSSSLSPFPPFLSPFCLPALPTPFAVPPLSLLATAVPEPNLSLFSALRPRTSHFLPAAASLSLKSVDNPLSWWGWEGRWGRGRGRGSVTQVHPLGGLAHSIATATGAAAW